MKIKAAGLALELAVNLLLPWLMYRLALPYVGRTGALYASAVPPLVWSLAGFARSRRVDALSVLVLVGIALSIAMMALGGSPRILLVRESLVSGVIGVVFLLSLLLDRPLTFYLARATVARENGSGAARFETLWCERPPLRASIRLMTLVWGAGLTAEALLRCWLAWQWPVERCLVVLPFVSYSIYGGLMLWTFWFRGRLRERERSSSGSVAGHPDGTSIPRG
ncbi:hypothetical protein C9I57_01700 [Trinickia symbiotica]|uniref:Transmembrane protein n=1 Tax=Trinickia symbiotica TaxID=863227 RepID=A0A2T3Y299_9BURK|nr:VC0807 family protein [Trinickia symbiotica]PTB22857.1 hypothetical protein C9I57_01700 [Trinickia symbiotica]